MSNPFDQARLRAKEWIANKITSPETMAIRDRLLDNNYFNNEAPHAKRFIQYLTGGVKGDVITELPSELKQKVVEAHNNDNYLDRHNELWAWRGDGHVMDSATGENKYANKETYWNSDMGVNERMEKFTLHPSTVKPDSTRLNTYTQARPLGDYESDPRLTYQVGDIDSFEPTGDGGYVLKDLWTVTPDSTDTFMNVYDLNEGGWPAALLYRGAQALGTNKPFSYEVPFSAEEMKKYSKNVTSK